MKSSHKRKRDTAPATTNQANENTGNSIIDSNSHNNKQKKKKKKRKKKRPSEEELHNEEAEARYSKLVHISAKTIRKEAKVCRAFECQKIVRKIKALKSSSSGNSSAVDVDGGGDGGGDRGVTTQSRNGEKRGTGTGTGTGTVITTATTPDKAEGSKERYCTNTVSKVERKIKNLEEKLRLTRAFELDQIVHTCLTRLGLDYTKASQKGVAASGGKKRKNAHDHINEKGQINNHNNEEEDEDEEVGKKKKKNTNDENEQYYNSLIESMLQHKKMLVVIESVNASVSEYNRWITKREEWLYRSSSKDKNTKKLKAKDRMDTNDTSAHVGNSGLFIDSLAGEEIHREDDDYDSDEYQDYDENVDLLVVKKNRMGQRARKARAMALESKKEGNSYNRNLSTKNWFEMKPKNRKKEKKATKTNELASGLDASKQVAVAEVATMGSTWKEEGKAHPSWAARQVQKEKSGSGIGNIEFKGKKITFD